MCVAAAGKVIEIDEKIAVVDFNGNIIRAHIGVLDVKKGDSVLVHAGLIIQVIEDSEADEIASLFKELKELSDE